MPVINADLARARRVMGASTPQVATQLVDGGAFYVYDLGRDLTRSFAAALLTSGTAGELSFLALVLPAGIGLRDVRMRAESAGGAGTTFRAFNGQMPASVRQAFPNNGPVEVRGGDAPAVDFPSAVVSFNVADGQELRWAELPPQPPGTAFGFQNPILGDGLEAEFWWSV